MKHLFAFFGLLASLASYAATNKTLVYCSEGSPSILNPQLATDGTTFNATKPVYDKLVDFKYGETTLVPQLATSWTISKDGTIYTFKLHKGVKFHTTSYFTPTRDFNADDVLFSFNRQRQNDHPFHSVSKGTTYEFFESMDMNSIIKNVEKVDDYTVKFTLNNPEAPFLANLAMDFSSILSAEYGDSLMKKKTPEKIDQDPIGTGPFVFVRYDKDQTIRYKANAQYFRGRPALDQLVFAITVDPSVRFQKLKAGECQFVSFPDPADLPAMKSDSRFNVMEKPGLNLGYVALNTEKAPFNNVLVRQAIHYALNRSAYIDAIYHKNAMVAKNPLPPTIWSYNNKIQDYEYNPAKAKELLAKAGLPNGFTTELWTLPVSRPYNPNGKKMGEMMQADLAKVGIQVKLTTLDWPTYLEKSKLGEHIMIQIGWTSDNGDPDNFLNTLLSCAAVKGGSNYPRWCDKEFDTLVQKAKRTSDVKARTKLYEEAQVIFKKQVPFVPLAHSIVYRTMAKNVHGYKIDPFGSDNFYEVDLREQKDIASVKN